MSTFSLLDHDADLSLEIYGRTLDELFENAVFALFSVMIERKAGTEDSGDLSKSIRVHGDGELLLSFLNEILYLWDTERIVVDKVSVELREGELEAKLLGRRFDPKKHEVKKEIKAATYHNFSIEKRKDGFVARVVFDV